MVILLLQFLTAFAPDFMEENIFGDIAREPIVLIKSENY